jgi:hypothetical protein
LHTISKNTNFIGQDVRKIYNHIFVNEHSLENGLRRFDPGYGTPDLRED